MAFLIDRDYLTLISQEDLDVVTYCDGEGTTPEQLIQETEANVLQEISSYLSGRYDMAKIFFETVEHLTGDSYTAGTFLYDPIEKKYYTALVDTQAGDVLTDEDIFEAGEKRNAIMKRHVINIVLYELHGRINPRYTPEFRIQRRDDSIKWLQAVQNPRNNVNADGFLPLKDFPEKSGNDISWNSREKQSNDY